MGAFSESAAQTDEPVAQISRFGWLCDATPGATLELRFATRRRREARVDRFGATRSAGPSGRVWDRIVGLLKWSIYSVALPGGSRPLVAIPQMIR